MAAVQLVAIHDGNYTEIEEKDDSHPFSAPRLIGDAVRLALRAANQVTPMPRYLVLHDGRTIYDSYLDPEVVDLWKASLVAQERTDVRPSSDRGWLETLSSNERILLVDYTLSKSSSTP